MKNSKYLTMTGLAHSFFSSFKFPIEKVKRDPVMLPALPHHGKAVIGTIVSGHRISET